MFCSFARTICTPALARGEIAPLADWLRANVWRHGRRYARDEILTTATGRKLDPAPYLRHATRRERPRESSMADVQNESFLRGYLQRFEIEKNLESDEARFEISLALSASWEESATTTIRFVDVRDVRFGEQHEGTNFGSYVLLRVSNVSTEQLDGIHYRVANVEQGLRLAFYCRAFIVVDVDAGE